MSISKISFSTLNSIILRALFCYVLCFVFSGFVQPLPNNSMICAILLFFLEQFTVNPTLATRIARGDFHECKVS